MSIPVALSDLPKTLANHDFAYLLTTSSKGSPRVVAIQPVLENGVFTIVGVGPGTRECVAARPQVTLLWPPRNSAAHSLISDGSAEVSGTTVRVTPTHAVLHRPAPAA